MELAVMVLLLVIPGSLAQEDMEGKMFLFPRETRTDHVILRSNLTKPLQKVSVCQNTFSELTRSYSLLSYATSRSIDAILIMHQPPITYTVYINFGSGSAVFKTDSEPSDWRHSCVTWDSDTGMVNLWVNGKFYSGGVVMKGSSIAAEASIILGQEQDSYGGGFDASQSLVGEVRDFHMWDYVLTAEDVKKVLSGDLHGNIINWKSLLYEIRGQVLVQPKNPHMENKVFVFPKETNTDHVILSPTLTHPLEKVSVCLRSYSDLLRPYAIFSLASPMKNNAFLIFLQPPDTCSVYINQEVTRFTTDSESLAWRHTCVTWDSDTGTVQLWVNGKLYTRESSMKGTCISTLTSIVLGQKQNSYGGGFDASESFVGEISDVHMWDRVLTAGDVQNVISGVLHGNVINWKSLVHKIKGEVLVQPKA